MSSSFNKYDIDEQFTEMAWKDMQSRLDKALPVKKPFFLSKWFGVAALFCLLSIGGGYWFVLQKGDTRLTHQKLAIGNDKPEIKEKTQQNKSTASEVIPKLKDNFKSNIKQLDEHLSTPVNTTKDTGKLRVNKSNKKADLTTVPPIKKNKSNKLTNNLLSLGNNLSPLQKNTETKPQLNADPEQVSTSVVELKKTNSIFISPLKQHHKLSKINHIISKTIHKPKTANLKKVNNLSIINGYLNGTPNLVKNTPEINQSSTGLSKNHELITQKNEDEKLHPKTIYYGIKQGLSSNLTSESKIFAGALIDFNLNKKWFIELAPTYQFGAINQKNQVQYDVVVATIKEKDEEPDEDYPPSYYLPAADPPSIEVDSAIVTHVHTKDTVTTARTVNRHYIAADLLLGYRITSRIEALAGVSSARSFSHQQENLLNSSRVAQEPDAFSNFKPLLYNNWSIAPKVALRFALKPKLNLETFYAYNLIPTVKKEFQLERSALNSSSDAHNYYSSNYGLSLVYKFK